MSKKKASVKPLGFQLRALREANDLSLTLAAAKAGVDIAILSKIERGKRKLNKSLLLKLISMYKGNEKELFSLFLAEKILNLITKEKYGMDAIKIVSNNLLSKKAKK